MTLASDLARLEGTARADAIVRLFAAGETSGHIAQLLGCTRNSVMGTIHRLRAAGDPRVPPARKANMGRAPRLTLTDRLAEHVAEGQTIAGAGWKLGLTVSGANQLWDGICRALGPQAV